MRFEDLAIKSYYDSRKTDVFNEFFNTVLPHSKFYRRFGGIFSAKSFALIAEGLQKFIKENNGIMELVVIPSFSEEDKKMLLNGIVVDDIVTKNWIGDLSKIKEKILEDHIKAICWMIANNYLTIRILIPEHENGTPFTESELSKLVIFKKEIGIFYNRDDDSILSFHGIIDRNNPEIGELYSLDVSRNWIDTERERINADHEDFTNYWNSGSFQMGTIRGRIVPLSKKLEDYFAKIAPQTKSEIPDLRKLPVLRKYQVDAISGWLENGGRGIFEMATGTGKTFTAIGGIKKIQYKEGKILVVIAAPYRNLLDQWKNELSKWYIESVILESGTWRQILRDEISYMNQLNAEKISVLITSHELLTNAEFVRQIEKCTIPLILVADEAHRLGTLSRQQGLSKNYTYRLALSATIARYFDDDGTEALRNYFKGDSGQSTIIEYSLEKAIGDKMLCGYNYYPFFVDLNQNEVESYRSLTRRAAILLNSKKLEDRKKGEDKIKERARIVKNAASKIDCFKEIIAQVDKLKHLLIFCSEKQFDDLDEILSNLGESCGVDRNILFRKITYDNPRDKKDRVRILNDFASEDWDILLSNQVLDEGLDIPQARRCIIMASTGNPTQFIQRRGRVLRTYSEPYKDGTKKTYADIFDVLVKPQIHDLEGDALCLETSIVKSQLNRIRQMGQLALNRDYCMKKIQEFTEGLPL